MGMKKVKISAVKRAQHLKGKKKSLKAQKSSQKLPENSGSTQKVVSKLFLNKCKKKVKHKKQVSGEKIENSENEEELVENIRDIIGEDDFDILEGTKKKSRKRKAEELDDDTRNFEDEINETFEKERKEEMTINLLPIKSKEGEIIVRTVKVDYKQEESNKDNNEDQDENQENVEYEDSDDDIVQGNELPKGINKKVISTADLLIHRQQEIERQKYRIGIICSGILEKPEDKMKNFKALFELMDETNESGVQNLLTVRKIATMSIAEVFKDILPEYRVGQVDTKITTVRKTTLERITYENALLQQFKKYLQKLERITSTVTKKGGNKAPQNVKLAEVAVTCLCDILVSHTYFNYVQNVAQLLVYMLDCSYHHIRETINACFRNVFTTDKRYDMTLFIIRRINHLVKTRSNNVHVDVITCFMSLRIKNINLDAEKENELKQKKLEAHRQRLLNLSKRERKRRKRLAELNKELQETKAEENKQTKHYKLTEIIKMIFTIYFRILKKHPNSKLLSVCLEGLAEFTHVINLEFFSDLVEVLNNLLETKELGYREQLHCIQTIFAILSGQGEVLNIDPIRFYGHLYRNLLVVHAGRNHDDFIIILKTLNQVLIKQRKNITNHRLLAFVKRVLTLSLQLLHNSTLASLGIVKTIMQHTSALDIILDTDTSVGSGRFDPELADPEYCNPTCTALYELNLLMKHYHPTVKKITTHVVSGSPASGEGSLPPEVGKLTCEELFTQFDGSQMAFNPSIPAPKSCETKLKKGRFSYFDPKLKDFCKSIIKKPISTDMFIDFHDELHRHHRKK